ncbi:uncharacterized protein FIBRA_00787 [Fibroporia radiculosa]|uniref:CRAL-TRIO domain-containing protein n=1 Tax=Fibroporia radiculosa TaxID=599839 RepID=J4HS68_9APHY|nr:uncharacterized protein FIBRA_00787 [Fibroporia radiculosa]CCL98782.1 predicted protein [Fibroporia radiculosa]
MAVDKEPLYEPPPVPHLPEKLTEFPPAHAPSVEHQPVLEEVIKYFSDESYVIPQTEDGQLRDEEKFWLSYECIHRYLRATKWAGAKTAITRLEDTLRWRREFGVYDLITPAHVEPEALTGKMVSFGYDVDGRPALYLRPKNQNTEESIRQMHFLTWMLERSVDLMGPGVENLALMVDFAARAKPPSLSIARMTVNILQNHYPERLGRALIVNVPFFVNVFLKLIAPFLDPVTRDKMRFNPSCVSDGLFTSDMLIGEWGGDCPFEYKHEVYWPALVQMCEKRRAKMMDTWRSLGGKVGLREWDVKCSTDFSGDVNAHDTPVQTDETTDEKADEQS